MKKLLLTLALVALPTMLFAQTTESQKQEREARRVARQQQYEAQLTKAIENKNFTFVAQSLQPATGTTQFVDPTLNYVSVYPNYMDVVLPSNGNSWFSNQAFNLDLYVTSYTYNYTISNGYIYLLVGFENAMGNQPNNFNRNFTYTFHFSINLISGSTNLTIVPNFSAPITYTGNVQLQ